tara:strand:+ start:17161 stop:17460 length:300 start_codon:yes stop_codon:yes gene_type:complete
MALLVSNTKIKNTEIEAPQLYVRLQYVAMPDGLKTQVLLRSGLNKEAVLNWETVATNLPESMMLEMLGLKQDLDVIHNLVKTELEKQGFEVVIDLPIAE